MTPAEPSVNIRRPATLNRRGRDERVGRTCFV